MRRFCITVVCTMLYFLYIGATQAATITPTAPTVSFPAAASLPNNGELSAPVNLTVWWDPYAQTSSGANVFTDAPISFEVQIATDGANDTCEAGDFIQAQIVYRSSVSGVADCASNNTCLGAGMAHTVCSNDSWGGNTDPYCGVFLNNGVDENAGALTENTEFCVRVRWLMLETDITDDSNTCGGTDLGATCASAYSTPEKFKTVDYSDSPNRYAAANGSGSTCSAGSPCSFSTAVGSGATAGDYILIYNWCSNDTSTPCDADNDCTGGGTCVAATYSVGSAPTTSDSRLKIIGASATLRPVIMAAYYSGFTPLTGTGPINIQFWDIRNMTDLYIANLDIRGQDTLGGCCNYACSNSVSTPCNNDTDCPGGFCSDGLDSQGRWYIFCTGSPTRVTFNNVDFRHIQLYCGDPGTNDLALINTLHNMEATNGPTETVLRGSWQLTRSGPPFTDQNAQRTTWHNIEFRGGFEIPMDGMDDLLMDGGLVYNVQNHVLRFEGDCARHTYRRLKLGDGPEGLSWTHAASGIANLVIENSTFANALNLTNCTGDSTGTVNYMVVRNTLFDARPVSRNVIFGDTPLGLCTCPGVESCDLYNAATDRMLWEYNMEWKTSESGELRNWEGSPYTRCDGGANLDFAAIMNFPFNKNEVAIDPFGCPDSRDDTRNPFISLIKSSDPDGAFNFSLQTISPAINAGHPDYITPVNGLNPVDLGAVETDKTQYTLTVNYSDPNSWCGLASSPAGVTVAKGPTSGSDSGTYDANTTVTLSLTTCFESAPPAEALWTGDNPDCSDGIVYLDRNTVCNAAVSNTGVTVSIKKTGNGDIYSSATSGGAPDCFLTVGTNAGGRCGGVTDTSSVFVSGHTIFFTLTPDSGWHLGSITGDTGCSATAITTIQPDSDPMDCAFTFEAD